MWFAKLPLATAQKEARQRHGTSRAQPAGGRRVPKSKVRSAARLEPPAGSGEPEQVPCVSLALLQLRRRPRRVHCAIVRVGEVGDALAEDAGVRLLIAWRREGR